MKRSANSIAAWTHGNLRGKVIAAQRGMTLIEEAETTSASAKSVAADVLQLLHELHEQLDKECIYPEPLKDCPASSTRE